MQNYCMVGVGENLKMSKMWVYLLRIKYIFIKLLLADSIVLSALYISQILILRLTLSDSCYHHIRDEETGAGSHLVVESDVDLFLIPKLRLIGMCYVPLCTLMYCYVPLCTQLIMRDTMISTNTDCKIWGKGRLLENITWRRVQFKLDLDV